MYVNSACKGKVVDLIVLAVVGWTSKFTYRSDLSCNTLDRLEIFF